MRGVGEPDGAAAINPLPYIDEHAYRALVIGTQGHVAVTRRILAAVKRRAERSAAAAGSP